MIIALMGIDGSGKTTIAKALKDRLEKMGKRVRYHAEFNYIFLNHLLKFFFRNRLEKATRRYLEEERKRPPVFKIWPYLVFLDCLIAYLKFKLLDRGKIIICDRYFYDFIIPFEALGDINWFIRRLFLSLPRPDLGFLLDVSPEIAYERTKDTHDVSVKWLTGWREKYLKLNQRLNFKVVSSEKPFEATMDEILACLS